MKQLKVLLSLMIVGAILFAFTLSAGAIGFSAEKIYESVFVIYCGNSLGSGFAVGKDCIITNAHVISEGRDVVIKTYSGEKHPATVVGMDPDQDIALLYVSDIEFEQLKVADKSSMKTGDDIYAIGAPKSMAYTLTKGVISAKERSVGSYSYIQIDAAINEGNSGGPLLNDSGEVLGVNTLKMSDSEGIGLAIPMSNVCDYMKSLDIKLDDSGNVIGSVQPDKVTNGSDSEEESRSQNGKVYTQTSSPLTLIACLVALISIALNIIMGILLLKHRNSKTPTVSDPRERTDFEIEILE